MRFTPFVAVGATLFAAGASGLPRSLAPLAHVQVLSSPNTEIRVFATAPTRFSVGGASTRIRGDTIGVRTPFTFKGYLDVADIHIEAATVVPIEVTATLRDAPALRLGGTGHRIVLAKGGGRIQVPW